MYRLVIWMEPDAEGESPEPLTMPGLAWPAMDEEELIEVTGLSWLNLFPDDIVMLVEE